METEKIIVAIQEAAETIATPNWAAILSVFISFLAVAVAGFVAWKQYGITKKQNEIVYKQTEIAGQQNKIALFEKRYELYQIVKDCLNMSKYILDYANNEDDIYTFFCAGRNKKIDPKSGIYKSEIQAEVIHMTDTLKQAEFLFSPGISEYAVDLAGYMSALFTLHIFPAEAEAFEKKKTNFYQAAKRFKNEGILEKMEEDLQLQSIMI